MNPTSLDKPDGPADDDHIARIVLLETPMDHVTGALVSLQRAQEAHHRAMLAGFASLRDKIDELRQDTNARFEIMTERFNRSLAEVAARSDHSLTEATARSDRALAEAIARFEHSQAAAAALSERSLEETSARFERSLERQDKRIDHLEQRIDHLSNRIDRLISWVAGLMVANLVAVVGFILRATGVI
jgi:hypothetical protein